jgi:hypothetical protein
MPENEQSKAATSTKKRHRKQLATAIQSNSTRAEISIKGRISSSPKAVSSNDFPLFRAFLLSVESDELFVKTSKNSIVSLSTGDKFSSAVSGYLVIL